MTLVADQMTAESAPTGRVTGPVVVGWLRTVWDSVWLRALLWLLVGHVAALHGVQFYQAWQGDNLLGLADRAINVEEFIFDVPMFLGLLALMFRRIDWRVLLLATLLAHLDNRTLLIDHYLHNFLQDHDVYPAMFRHGNPNQPVNIQLAILSCYAVVYALLWLTVLLPARRTMGRVFVLLIMTVTLGTTLLFHQVVVDHALGTTLAQERLATRQYLTRIIDVPEDTGFMTLCRRSGAICLTGTGDQPPVVEAPRLVPRIAAAYRASRDVGGDPVLRVEAVQVGGLASDLRGQQFAFYGNREHWRLAVDMTSYNHLPARYKLYFAALVAVAHLWWVYGGFALLAFHQSRFAWRFARNSHRREQVTT